MFYNFIFNVYVITSIDPTDPVCPRDLLDLFFTAVAVLLLLAVNSAWRVYVAENHSAGDPGLVSLGLHVDPSSLRLAGSAVRRQARIRVHDADVIT